MHQLSAMTMNYQTSREQQIRAAVLLTFCDPMSAACQRLEQLSGKEWQRLLTWLDTSGLALYLYDRLVELNQVNILPPDVLARLRRNLAENIARTEGMLAELKALHLAFESKKLSYVVLKGISLWPHSVPRAELRSQLDLDFLIAAKSAPVARKILESRGYHLRAISGRSWEFKMNDAPGRSLKSLYKDSPSRSVELHVEDGAAPCGSLVDRAAQLCIGGSSMPVLAPADLFLGQGMHCFKHICSEFSRAAHLIEFRRHVLARYSDMAFWSELRQIARQNSRAPFALGIITLLITHVMGEFAPDALTSWTADKLPSRVRLWVELYGRRAVLTSFPGNKLYLLLQRELASSGVPSKRSLRQALLPLSFPPLIVHAQTHETPWMCARRYGAQLRFVLFRVRFHAVQGLSYLRESARWRRSTNGLAS
jgi:hypothetical protein